MRVMTMRRKIITICAECKRELKTMYETVLEDILVPSEPNEEIVYSHGVCFECGVKLYGAKIMAKVGAGFGDNGRI
jgi:hypothetical protein